MNMIARTDMAMFTAAGAVEGREAWIDAPYTQNAAALIHWRPALRSTDRAGYINGADLAVGEAVDDCKIERHGLPPLRAFRAVGLP